MMTPKDIADALLVKTCHSVCAFVCIAGEKVLSVSLFDPQYYHAPKEAAPGTEEIWLIANHECGETEPRECEWIQLRELMRCAPGIAVRFFLSSEYWDCCEICLVQRHAM